VIVAPETLWLCDIYIQCHRYALRIPRKNNLLITCRVT